MKTKKLSRILAIVLLLAMLILPTLCVNRDTRVFAQTGEIRYGDQLYNANARASTLNSEIVTYSRVSSETFYINGSYPRYHNENSSLTNACAPVGGSNIVGFYDRYYDELIPDYTVGFTRSGNFNYYPMTYNITPKQNVINQLYNLMGTNIPEPGTTQSQYKLGLTAYINSKGKSISYTSVLENGNLNFSSLDNQLRLGKPISLFLSGYSICDFVDNGAGEFEISKLEYDSNHIMICFGYEKYVFYDNSNNIISTKTFLVIATGQNGVVGYYLINNNGTLNDAEAAYVY